MKMKLVLESPLDDKYAELPLEEEGVYALRHEDLMIGERVIAQLHDDNYWRINDKYNKWPEVDGWSHIKLER